MKSINDSFSLESCFVSQKLNSSLLIKLKIPLLNVIWCPIFLLKFKFLSFVYKRPKLENPVSEDF